MARADEAFERPSEEVLRGMRELMRHDSFTCALADCMGGAGAMSSRLLPLFDGVRFVGPAVTAWALASDLSAPFRAIDLCEAGDVVVVDAGGSTGAAFWGENMALSALNRGAAGAVVDGACRDVEELRGMRFPLLSRGAVPNVGSVAGHGRVNVPVQCAGVAVRPGDVVAVDGNGAVVVPREEAGEVLASARELLATEHLLQERIRAGATIGELVGVEGLLGSAARYQDRGLERDC